MRFSDDHFKKDKLIWYRSSDKSRPSEKWGAGNPDPEIRRGPGLQKFITGGAGPLGPPPVDPPLQSHHPLALGLIQYNFCGRQEEPTNLISRLLLRMRHMYVASIHLGFH